jgi:hypothetical protein
MFYATHVFFILNVRKRVEEFDCRAEILEPEEFVQGEHLEIVHTIPNATDMPMTRQERSHMGLEVLVIEVKGALLGGYAGDFG